MAFTEEQKEKAWQKARKVDGYDEKQYRKDACGAWIAWNRYGRHDSPYGWEIDHILPLALGGTDREENLRALQHQNKASKGDDYPSYMAEVRADGMENVTDKRLLNVNAKKRAKLNEIYGI